MGLLQRRHPRWLALDLLTHIAAASKPNGCVVHEKLRWGGEQKILFGHGNSAANQH